MIVVRAMPVVNAKARTKTTKIVFMTLALCSDGTRMPEQGKRSVIAVTEHTFSQPSGARIGDRPAKSLYSWIFAGQPVRLAADYLPASRCCCKVQPCAVMQSR